MAEKMLVIDDEQVVIDSISKSFADEDYEITGTKSPEMALDLIRENTYDVILCDWNMPGIDGMEVISQIEKHSPESTVLMISGYPSVDRATEAMKRGALDFLPKPFTPEELKEAVLKAEKKKIINEKKSLSRFQSLMGDVAFPKPEMDDKAPATIADTVSKKVGVGKVTSPWLSVFILGILAGAYIGFGGVLSTTVTHDMASFLGVGFTKFMSGAVFSLGLMMVIIAGAELFTGNNLMISSVMTGDITLGKMLARWGIVYVANFVGSMIIVFLFFYSGLWKTGGNAVGEAAVSIASGKVSLPFGEALIRAIGCNWIVCLAVWMALSARQTVGKIFAVFFPIMGFVAMGFEHSIANMYFVPMGMMLKNYAGVAAPSGFDPAALNVGSFIVRNLIPVTIGNIIGGVVFVGMSYYSAYLKPRAAK
ncbi:MAG: formate/nitrite family transporter [Spirochaetia bacterium]